MGRRRGRNRGFRGEKEGEHVARFLSSLLVPSRYDRVQREEGREIFLRLVRSWNGSREKEDFFTSRWNRRSARWRDLDDETRTHFPRKGCRERTTSFSYSPFTDSRHGSLLAWKIKPWRSVLFIASTVHPLWSCSLSRLSRLRDVCVRVTSTSRVAIEKRTSLDRWKIVDEDREINFRSFRSRNRRFRRKFRYLFLNIVLLFWIPIDRARWPIHWKSERMEEFLGNETRLPLLGKGIIYADTWTICGNRGGRASTLGRWIARYKFSARIARNLLEVVTNKVGRRVWILIRRCVEIDWFSNLKRRKRNKQSWFWKGVGEKERNNELIKGQIGNKVSGPGERMLQFRSRETTEERRRRSCSIRYLDYVLSSKL